MKEVDYLIIGGGLGGLSMSLQCILNDKTFIVMDDDQQSASFAAAGLINPITGRNYVKSWNMDMLLDSLEYAYALWEKKLGVKVLHDLEIRRVLNSIHEENKWFGRREDSRYTPFMDLKWQDVSRECNLQGDFLVVRLKTAYRLDIVTLVNGAKDFLTKRNSWINESFNWNDWNVNSNMYHDIKYDKIVFARGAYEKGQPFAHLPIIPNIGEVLMIKIHPEYAMNYAIKKKVFIVPMGDNVYWVGGTYRNIKTEEDSKPKYKILEKALEKTLNVPYKIISKTSGIRPTVPDRRPLIGVHEEYSHIGILNGLGTKGSSLSPYCAECLYNHMENGGVIPQEIDIKRY